MKFRLLIVLFFLESCSPNYTKIDNRKPYNSTGFAYIFNESDYENKIIKKKLNNDQLEISHSDLKIGSLIKLINPKTKEYIVLKNTKQFLYPDFYKIVITKTVAEKLNIDNKLPLVEILEVKKNKSFIAEKAKIYQEEKKISSKAPITSVKIANISNEEGIRLGFRTTSASKPAIIGNLKNWLFEEELDIKSSVIIQELKDYLSDDRGSTGAGPGCFDDSVMALAIACEVYRTHIDKLTNDRIGFGNMYIPETNNNWI